MENIGKRIDKALSIRHMRQADLARITGINKGSISCYIAGDYDPKQTNIYLMAKALDVSEAWLLGFDVPAVSPYFMPIYGLF